MTALVWTALALPLAGAVLLAVLGTRLPARGAGWLASLVMLAAFICSAIATVMLAAQYNAWAWVVAGVIVASSLLTLTYFLPVLEAVWFRPDPDGADAPRCEAGPLATLPVAVLAVGLLVIGILNVPIVEQVLDPVSTMLAGQGGP